MCAHAWSSRVLPCVLTDIVAYVFDAPPVLSLSLSLSLLKRTFPVLQAQRQLQMHIEAHGKYLQRLMTQQQGHNLAGGLELPNQSDSGSDAQVDER